MAEVVTDRPIPTSSKPLIHTHNSPPPHKPDMVEGSNKEFMTIATDKVRQGQMVPTVSLMLRI